MKLIIVSGRSGSGKSTALHVLEDLGFYCIDNLPIGLLFPLTREAVAHEAPGRLKKMAVSIDARNLSGELANFEDIYQRLGDTGIEIEIIFLDADEQSLLQRFHATRRKHPLSDDKTSLREAISNEKQLLEPLSKLADLYINTTGLSMYELRDMVKQRVAGRKEQEIAEWNRHELSSDCDQINARRITNIGTLRAYVIAYLQSHPRIKGADFTLMVRQLPPGPEGLPIEIYCFTDTVDWGEYEAIQADIFDHLLAILPEFGLRLFQQPSGLDFARLGGDT